MQWEVTYLQWARRPWRLQQNMLMALFHEFVMLVDSQWLHCRIVVMWSLIMHSLVFWHQKNKAINCLFFKLTPTRSELMVKPLMAAWGCWGLSSLLIWASFRLVGAGNYPKSTKYKAWPLVLTWCGSILQNNLWPCSFHVRRQENAMRGHISTIKTLAVH